MFASFLFGIGFQMYYFPRPEMNLQTESIATKKPLTGVEQWIDKTKPVSALQVKRFLSGKEFKSEISVIIENALAYNNHRKPTIQPGSDEIVWFQNNNLWAESLKKKKGWIFNDVCPDACISGKKILWGRSSKLCPMMFRPEIRLLMRHLRPESHVLEFGAGVSTIYYSQCTKRYDTIEADSMAWCNSLQQHIPPGVNVHCKPKDVQHSEFLKTLCIVNPDVVLIDGSNRPEIAKAIIPYISEKTDVFLHDYTSKRLKKLHYEDILQDYDLVAFGSPSLGKFKLKKSSSVGFNRKVHCPK
jgi:hypothetical protein